MMSLYLSEIDGLTRYKRDFVAGYARELRYLFLALAQSCPPRFASRKHLGQTEAMAPSSFLLISTAPLALFAGQFSSPPASDSFSIRRSGANAQEHQELNAGKGQTEVIRRLDGSSQAHALPRARSLRAH